MDSKWPKVKRLGIIYAVGQDDCDDESDGDIIHVILCMGVYVGQTFLMSTCGPNIIRLRIERQI